MHGNESEKYRKLKKIIKNLVVNEAFAKRSTQNHVQDEEKIRF